MTKLRGSRLKDVRLRERRRITAGIEHHGGPSWSPDGQLLCSALGTGHSSMWLVTDRKGRVARLIEGPVDGGASFGPDHALAYGRQVGATAEIWLMPSIDGAPYRLLGGDGRLYRDPAFSPDGSTLAYLADDGPAAVDGTLRLWLLDLAKNETTLLLSELSWGPVSPEPVRISRPRWSTDAQYLFFEGSKGKETALFLIDPHTRQVRQVSEAGYCHPAPLTTALLIAQRLCGEKYTELVLMEYRAPRGHENASAEDLLQRRVVALTGRSEGAREPAVAIGKKGTPLLAWSMSSAAAEGEPTRHNLHVGELRGVAVAAPELSQQALLESEEESVARESEAASAGLSATVPVSRGESSRREGGASSERPVPSSVGPLWDEAPADAERGV